VVVAMPKAVRSATIALAELVAIALLVKLEAIGVALALAAESGRRNLVYFYLTLIPLI
jgi:hypothetical protein